MCAVKKMFKDDLHRWNTIHKLQGRPQVSSLKKDVEAFSLSVFSVHLTQELQINLLWQFWKFSLH
jgi:hypothetical protein